MKLIFPRIEPLLYRVLFISSSSRGIRTRGFLTIPSSVLVNLISTKPASFFESSVQHIFFSASDVVPLATVKAILTACPGITSLFPARCEVPTNVRPLGAFLPSLRRLSIDVTDLFPAHLDFTESVFRNLTHLEILDSWNPHDSKLSDLWNSLALIPHLTQISFNSISLYSITPTEMQANTRLQCIVVLFMDKFQDDEMDLLQPLSQDVRFVCIEQQDRRLDWLRGAHGGEDYWTRAEEFIAAKDAGRVDRAFSLGLCLCSVSLIHL
jgi:hypothetical protein